MNKNLNSAFLVSDTFSLQVRDRARFVRLYGEFDRTGRQTMPTLTCNLISSVDLECDVASHVKDLGI